MNQINFNTSGALVAGLPNTTSQAADSQKLDALESEFIGLLNSAPVITDPLLKRLDDAAAKLLENSNDPETAVDFQMAWMQMNNISDKVMLTKENQEIFKNMNQAVGRMRDNPGDSSPIMDFRNLVAELSGKFNSDP